MVTGSNSNEDSVKLEWNLSYLILLSCVMNHFQKWFGLESVNNESAFHNWLKLYLIAFEKKLKKRESSKMSNNESSEGSQI